MKEIIAISLVSLILYIIGVTISNSTEKGVRVGNLCLPLDYEIRSVINSAYEC